MHNTNYYLKMIFCGIILFSCGGNKSTIEASPDTGKKEGVENNSNIPGDSDVDRNMSEIIEDLKMDIKKLKAELDYQHENLVEMKAQSQIWANPFAIYNKEIVLSNGSSVFGKIVYQDQDVMKIETLIGQLIINRNTIVRVVNQISAYSKFNGETSDEDGSNDLGMSEPSGINLIQKRITSLSAHLVLVGDITEEKD